MGCEPSHSDQSEHSILLSVIDPGFLKPIYQTLRTKLESHNVELKIFMNVSCFINEINLEMPKYIVIKHENLKQIITYFSQKKYIPQIIVLENKLEEKINFPKIKFIQNYSDLTSLLLQFKKEEISKNNQKIEIVIKKQKETIDIKILKDFRNETESQIFILEQTLKLKEITFLTYNTLEELLFSHEIPCKFIIVDYQYHREIIKSVNPRIVKVICYCDLDSQQKYDSQIYYFTNNFQEIVNQVSFYKSFKMPVLPLTKLFFYCPIDNKIFSRYAKIFQEFNFEPKCFTNVQEILKVARLYFCILLFCPEDEVFKVQNIIQKQNSAFRVRVIGIEQETQCSAKGMRKFLKEAKRGYLYETSATRVVDIIDKHHNGNKFVEIKQELIKNSITFRCYSSLVDYVKKFTFIAPYIICSYDQRIQLSSFIDSIQSKTKIIIFCNKIFIDQAFLQSKKWCYVSSQFTKIVRFIKVHQVILPIILDHNQNRILKKQEQIKNKQHRISAIKWAQTTKSQISIKEDQMSFILTKNDNFSLSLKEICNDSCELLKLGYNPFDSMDKFKIQLLDSVTFLIHQNKILYSKEQQKKFQDQIKQMNLHELGLRVSEFFGKEKQLGICLNNVIKRIAKEDKNVIFHLKSIFYLINLNFLGYYRIPNAQKIILCNWSKEEDLLHCKTGSLLIFKNYLVMYQEGFSQPLPGCIKLELEVEYCALNDLNPSINSFFVHNGRYVFSPFSRLVVTQIQKENKNIVIHLKLKRQVDFLKYYYSQNISKDMDTLFDNQLKKNESKLITAASKTEVSRNHQRLMSLRYYRTGNIQKSIKLQRELIKSEEENQNFNSKYITELQFQLANYLLKQNATAEVLKLLQDINQNNSSNFINTEVSKMIEKTLSNIIEVKENNESAKFQEQALQCIQLKQQLQIKEKSQNQQKAQELPFIFGFQMIKGSQNKIECLEIDDRDWDMQNFG